MDLAKIQNMDKERLEDACLRPAGAAEAMGMLEIPPPICSVCSEGQQIVDFMEACEMELERSETQAT
jgi:hypothetical protein